MHCQDGGGTRKQPRPAIRPQLVQIAWSAASQPHWKWTEPWGLDNDVIDHRAGSNYRATHPCLFDETDD